MNGTGHSLTSGLLAVSILALLLVSGASPSVEGARPRPGPGGGHGGMWVEYNATSDGWRLSFTEYLPAHFDGRTPHPLVVYLHGMQQTGARWVDGGVPSDFFELGNSTATDGRAIRGILENASSLGYILIVPNTRTGDGFYTDTPCGGPQGQDILDAIAFERSRQLVSQVYLIGFSMGSEGAFILAATHPGAFAGIAVAGTNLDMFAALAYRAYAAGLGERWAAPSIRAAESGTCGIPPGRVATIDGYYALESVGRLRPQALSGVPIWVAAGGRDDRVPNNPRIFGYLQVNNSFVNSTCRTYPGEPAGCTVTYWALHNASPSQFQFRYIYEGRAQHSPGQFIAADMFAWFEGRVPWGFYLSDGLASPIVVNPHPGR